MFDWFTKKDKTPSNVVPFPEPKAVPPMPEVHPARPAAEKPTTVFYRFGITDANRLALQVGYSEITMNKQGIQNLIDQLEFFKDRMVDEDD